MEVNVTAREYIVQTLENIEKARAVARENLQEHKTEMLNKANRNREHSNFSVGDIVYLYTPATTPNLSRKLRRPCTGPFYIVERLSKIHVRLRRKCDGKLLKTRVHVDRIKPGFVWTGEPRDPKPPPNELEPLEIHEHDIPGDNFEQVEPEVQPSQVPINENVQDNINNNKDNNVFSIEKIIKKKKVGKKWTYRVKWLGYGSAEKFWVEFEDLTPECQEYVKRNA
ncbi:Hypothetical predicted protein [Mytilus galloprovincialis]|uniref:Chromo domain-containing protein n=1 Tax=Mytilus galloprovincialis TaxID=29158 RepID=A0A8B6BP49_MYTGA|nr:Hypothetical predicted protein [Mytilus galloprovincialis]